MRTMSRGMSLSAPAGVMATIGLGLVCGLLVVTASPAAETGEGRGKWSPEERLESTMTDMKAKLGLSEEQEAQVRALYAGYYEKSSALRKEGKGSRGKNREEREALRTELETSLATVLTAEQMKAYQSWQEERRKEMRKRRGSRGGGEKGEGGKGESGESDS